MQNNSVCRRKELVKRTTNSNNASNKKMEQQTLMVGWRNGPRNWQFVRSNVLLKNSKLIKRKDGFPYVSFLERQSFLRSISNFFFSLSHKPRCWVLLLQATINHSSKHTDWDYNRNDTTKFFGVNFQHFTQRD